MKANFVIILLAVLSTVIFIPSIWVNLAVLVDFYTPWVLFDSSLYKAYHHYLVDSLPVKDEIPMLEIPASEANMENIIRLTQGWTFPVIIRGLLGNTSAIQKWSDHTWWTDNYGSEELLCGSFSNVIDNCTVASFFDAVAQGKPFYVTGASIIFQRHPELHEMIDNEHIKTIEPGLRTTTQVFMGVPGSGSDVHAAMGVNIFRQVAGRKKWWFIPPHQTAYLMPSINVNGFSAHTKTLIDKVDPVTGGAQTASPWLNKITRYTAVVNPGDVLINPPWFWHAILNLGSPKDIIIGSPVRYGKGATVSAAFRTNLMFTLNGIFTVIRKHGMKAFTAEVNLQEDIAGNRKDRTVEKDE